LKDIEHLFRAFVHEGDRADLNRDVRLSVILTRPRSIEAGCNTRLGCIAQAPHRGSKLEKLRRANENERIWN